MQLGISSKDEMKLITFQSIVANALIHAGKSIQPKRRQPSITPPRKKKTGSNAIATPINNVPYNDVGHNQTLIRSNRDVVIVQRDIPFCFVWGRNCFKNIHL